jgi:hypothetical protein
MCDFISSECDDWLVDGEDNSFVNVDAECNELGFKQSDEYNDAGFEPFNDLDKFLDFFGAASDEPFSFTSAASVPDDEPSSFTSAAAVPVSALPQAEKNALEDFFSRSDDEGDVSVTVGNIPVSYNLNDMTTDLRQLELSSSSSSSSSSKGKGKRKADAKKNNDEKEEKEKEKKKKKKKHVTSDSGSDSDSGSGSDRRDLLEYQNKVTAIADNLSTLIPPRRWRRINSRQAQHEDKFIIPHESYDAISHLYGPMPDAVRELKHAVTRVTSNAVRNALNPSKPPRNRMNYKHGKDGREFDESDLPFMKHPIDPTQCIQIVTAHGHLKQCPNKACAGSLYCDNKKHKLYSGFYESTIYARMSLSYYDYSFMSDYLSAYGGGTYRDYLFTNGFSVQDALNYAAAHGIVIPPEHFVGCV